MNALLAFAAAVEEHGPELVELEAQNTGKPVGLTLSEEIGPMVDQLRFFAGAARHLEGRATAEYMEGHSSSIRREPLGVDRVGGAVELPDDDGGLEDRARAGGREHDGAQAVGHHARLARCGWASWPPRSCRPACSTSCAATGRPARRMADHDIPAMVAITGSVRGRARRWPPRRPRA